MARLTIVSAVCCRLGGQAAYRCISAPPPPLEHGGIGCIYRYVETHFVTMSRFNAFSVLECGVLNGAANLRRSRSGIDDEVINDFGCDQPGAVPVINLNYGVTSLSIQIY